MAMLRYERPCPSLSHDEVMIAAESLGLIVKEMGRKTPHGARHWHLYKPGSKGVLEITWLPTNLVIVEARSNRSADWQSEVAAKFGGYP